MIVDTSAPTAIFAMTGLVRTGGGAYATSSGALGVTFTHDDPESGSQAAYGVECDGQAVSWHDTWEAVRSATAFVDGGRYRAVARATNGVSLSTTKYGDWFIYDATSPMALSYVVMGDSGGITVGSGLRVTARASDSGSGLSRIGLAIGSAPGATELSTSLPGADSGYLWKPAASGEASFAFTIPDGAAGAYYATIVAENRAGSSTSRSETAQAFAITAGGGMVVKDQGPYTSDATSLVGQWAYTGVEAVTGYDYRVVGSDGSATAWAATTETELRISGLSLTGGVTYRVEVRAALEGGGTSSVGQSLGILVDVSDATIAAFTVPEACGSGDFWVGWTASDGESGIGRVELLVETRTADGESAALGGGWRDLYVTSEMTRIPVTLADDEGANLLTHGARVYATIRITNGAGKPVETRAPVTIIDDTPPETPVVVDQGDSINTMQASDGLSVHWIWSEGDSESGIASYEWAIAKSRDGFGPALWHDVGQALSVETGALAVEHSETVYFAVRATNGAGATSVGISNGIICDSTAPFIAGVQLTRTQGDADVNYLSSDDTLKLAIEAYEPESAIRGYYGYVGTVDGTGEWSERGEQHWSGVDATLDLGIDPIPDGSGVVVFRGESENESGQREYGYTTGVMIDIERPVVSGVYGINTISGLSFDWTVQRSIAPIVKYEVALRKVGDIKPDVWTNVGLVSRYTIPATELIEGMYTLCVRATSASGMSSFTEIEDSRWQSAIVVYDVTPPELVSLTCPAYASRGLKFTMEAVDALSGIREYQYALGSADDPTIYSGGWNSVSTRSGNCTATFSFDDLAAPVRDGERIYLMTRIKNGVGLWSEIAASGRVVVDMSAPMAPIVSVGQWTRYLNRVEGASLSAKDLESGITHYAYGAVADGETEPAKWIVESVTGFMPEFALADTTIAGLELMDGGRYRIAVKAMNGAGDWSVLGRSEPITADATAPALLFTESGSTIVVNDGIRPIGYRVDEDCTIRLTIRKPNGEIETLDDEAIQANVAREYPFAFEREGIYIVSGATEDAAGNVGNVGAGAEYQRVRRNARPVIVLAARFDATPGKPLTLTASVHDPDAAWTPGGTLAYSWSQESGTPESDPSPGRRYYHRATWDQRSEYPVTLTVTDPDGKSVAATTVVVVENTRAGTLFVDEYWHGEHELRGDVLVPAGLTLTVDTATRVVAVGNSISGWSHGLRVEGTLLASDTVFEERDVGRYWAGITVLGHATLTNARVSGAERGVAVLGAASVDLSGARLTWNEIGVHAYGCAIRIAGARFTRNAFYGIKEDAGALVEVDDSVFTANGYAYYDETLTTVDIAELNTFPGNSGNIEE